VSKLHHRRSGLKKRSGQLAGRLRPQGPHRRVLQGRLIAGFRGEHPTDRGNQQHQTTDRERPAE